MLYAWKMTPVPAYNAQLGFIQQAQELPYVRHVSTGRLPPWVQPRAQHVWRGPTLAQWGAYAFLVQTEPLPTGPACRSAVCVRLEHLQIPPVCQPALFAQEAHSPALPGLRFACAVWEYTVPRQHLFAKPVRWVPTHSTHQRASTALPTRLRLRLPRHVLFVPQECFKQASGHLFVPLALKGLSFSIPRRVKTAAQELTHFIL